eukprot:10305346-Ditylum_brightwellii.AAC.1
MYWLHMHTVQKNGTPKGIPTKITCGAGRSVAGAPPRDFVGKGVEVVPHYWDQTQHVSFLYQGRRIAHDIHNPTNL